MLVVTVFQIFFLYSCLCKDYLNWKVLEKFLKIRTQTNQTHYVILFGYLVVADYSLELSEMVQNYVHS